ncbi:MAG: hypothetical protein QM831_09345 [Kofleriaceae bacterium]
MRILSLLFIAAACVHGSEDPRLPTAEAMTKNGLGGWIVLHRPNVVDLGGELIAMDPTYVYLYDARVHGFWFIPKKDVTAAELYMYTSSGAAPWVVGNVLTTASHGILLIATLPIISLVDWGFAYSADSSSRLEYPDKSWEQLDTWSRFPQGLPPNTNVQTLEH